MNVEEDNAANNDAIAMAKLAQRAASAAADRANDMDDEDDDDGAVDNGDKNMGQQSRRAYLRELRKTVERADVILQVTNSFRSS